jgi:Predicted transcriptional regulators
MATTDLEAALIAVGPRLRQLREQRGLTLTDVGLSTGVAVSTLSRLESGGRRPTLELLLPLAKTYQVSLDELVDAPPTGDPRVNLRAIKVHGMTMLPLSQRPGGIQAYKIIVPRRRGRHVEPDLKTHEGYDWLYVLSGKLRLVLGEHDLVLQPGEVAEFDTRTPHWFGAADEEPVECLSLFGTQGEKAHVRARPANGAS